MKINYRMGFALPALIASILAFGSCKSSSKNSSVLQQSAIGKPGELMLVMDKDYFESPMAMQLYDLLEEDAPALPQSEPSLRISRVPTPSFEGSLKLVRNVFLLDIDPQRYSKVSLKYSYDDWAKGQIVARMTSPSADSVQNYLKTQGEGLMNLFIRHELFLYGEVIAKTYSQKATELVDSLFAHRVNVPEDIRNKRVGKDFLWMSNSSMRSLTTSSSTPTPITAPRISASMLWLPSETPYSRPISRANSKAPTPAPSRTMVSSTAEYSSPMRKWLVPSSVVCGRWKAER